MLRLFKSRLTMPVRQILAALLFLASIGVNAHTLYTALHPRPIAEELPVTLLTEPADLAAAEHDVRGTYITGERAGDRLITIEAGSIRFVELGAPDGETGDTTTYRIARCGKHLCLVTADYGIVEIVGLDALAYFGDRYLRTESPPLPADHATPPNTQRGKRRVARQ